MKQILCFGDSNTYGLIPGTENRYNWEIRWTGRLDAAVRGKGYRVIEEG
ncbi:MAG: arylesterase, partial [Lachnospiraceae bacterium]|nr:arylesterase [Lachnospiraceae bacterium]